MNGPYVLQFDYLFHNPNPAIDEYLHGDHTHTDEDGNEVVSPGTPDRPVVIDPDPDPDPDPDADPPNANPGPAPDAAPQQAGAGLIEPLTKAKLDALTLPASVPTGGVFRGGTDNEFIWDGKIDSSSPTDRPFGNFSYLNVNSYTDLLAIYGVNVREDEQGHAIYSGGDEQLYGGDGNDVLVGGWGDDILDGGPGNDYLFGGLLYVWDGRPATVGRGGNINILKGGPGNDYLESGGRAIDYLDGGPGNDHLVSSHHGELIVMIGGPGRDVFDVSENGLIVKIMDFQDGADKILISRQDYTTGELAGHYLDFHQQAAKAGVQWDMGWIATEVDNGVTLPLSQTENEELTIEGAYLANLQFEIVNGDLFIV